MPRSAVDMQVSPPRVEGRIPMCDGCQARAWVFGQRMEEQAVYDKRNALVEASEQDYTRHMAQHTYNTTATAVATSALKLILLVGWRKAKCSAAGEI